MDDLREQYANWPRARRKSARVAVRMSFSNFKNTMENPVDVDAEGMKMEQKKDANVNVRLKIKIPSSDVKSKIATGEQWCYVDASYGDVHGG
ncbi:hypothetical protein L6452_13380 [Arctium lappa]|uniref:Uncharacterized protein n=1 Tax=Arctium lappa TaxID=4217 RepID=A0ACB9CHZ2_ARCLA|nr:hypothetical protein L6452_13380 [Arctium lappa]